MNGDDSPLFVDTNVLVYATVADAPFHREALTAVDAYHRSGVELWISRQVLREYMATVTRPQAFGSPPPIATLIAEVRSFQARFRVAEDGPSVTERLLSLVETVPMGGKQIHDANIVATMQVYGIRRLLTHNARDFARFSQLITVVPLV